MNRILARINKAASTEVERVLKELCVEHILEDNGVRLSEMSVSDVVDYLEANETLTFENIQDLVEDWIQETEDNYPELLL